MQDPTEDEFLIEQDPIVDLRRVQIHAARLAEIGAERSFDASRVQVHAEAVRSDAEGTTAELLFRRERTNRLEISGREFFADDVSEAEPACRALDRARDLESEEIPTERRATDLDPLRCHRGERFRAREGRMFPGELDNNAHVRRTSPANMSLPPTVIFKWPGPFAPPGCASGPSSRTTSPRSRRSSGKRYARIIRPRCTSTSTAGGGTASSQVCAMRGIRTIELEVRISNDEAIHFYKRYGFAIAGVLEKFYTDGEDGYKMIKHF